MPRFPRRADWSGYLVASWIDQFFVSAYGVSYAAMGWLSILPYVLLCAFSLGAGPAADALEQRGRLRAGIVRKGCNTLGMGGQAAALLVLAALVPRPGLATLAPLSNGLPAAGALPSAPSPPPRMPAHAQSGHAVVAAGVLALSSGLSGIATAGYWVNFVELSPVHSQLLCALSNSLASLPGVGAQLLTGVLLTRTHDDWALIFVIAAAVNLAGVASFLLLSESRKQAFDTAPSYCAAEAEGEAAVSDALPVQVGASGGGGTRATLAAALLDDVDVSATSNSSGARSVLNERT